MVARFVAFEKQRAAEGSPTSQYDVAIRYLTGNGVEKDQQQARHYLEMAARQGYGPAVQKLKDLPPASTLGHDAARGTNVDGATGAVTRERTSWNKKDLSLLVKEAAAGSAQAQYELGMRYLAGDGVEKNLPKAKAFLELSSAQGNTSAKEQLEKLNAYERPAVK
jgi:TPR repeat protein